jgi:3-deoxy-D-manno-octulosonic acid kinase
LIHPDYAETVTHALCNSKLYEARDAGGRGKVYQFPLNDNSQGIVRTYARGGFIRHLNKSTYLMDNRPLRELKVWCHAFSNEVSVPMPLGVMWKKNGPFYSGAIATRYVDSMHLQDYLNQASGSDESFDILGRVGHAIRIMHNANINHADLQIRNILVDKSRKVYIIDFDNAEIMEGKSSFFKDPQSDNLARLQRSFVKNGFSVPVFNAIWQGYGTLI